MFGLMLKKTHNDVVESYKKDVIRCLDRVSELKDEITQDNAKIVELHNALADEKKTSSKLRGLIATQEQSLIALNSRLENSVDELLSVKSKRILKAMQEGKYIYRVTLCERTLNIEIPMSSSNCARTAKRKALAKWGLGADYLQLCEAERWVI